MFSIHAYVLLVAFFLLINNSQAITSPLSTYTNYTYSIELQTNVADLWWTVDEEKQAITFELHIKTTGWIALGISPAGGMTGADIGVGWIDQSGALHFQDRYASGKFTPVIDNTTTDWFGLQGREENGWTAIQFKRPIDSCDTMDTPITSGTNILIFAYGLTDPESDITYHQTRKGSRIIPLRSYSKQPPESKFDGLDYFDFHLNNYVVPTTDTTYHCKVYRVPKNLTERRHAIAQKILLNSSNVDIVHHLLMYECPPQQTFDDDNLPEGVCDDIDDEIESCMTNIASGWAVGGDYIVEYPEVVGYALGGDVQVTYFVVQIHYDNPKGYQNRMDSTGIRFYLGNELRQNDLGFLQLGAEASVRAIAIPPGVERFVVDTYCTENATQGIPEDGITVFSAFPHTHLQGRTVWTKIIRNQIAEQYLFNADSFDFNYQYENRLSPPIKLYPGDELATRCIYNTMNKNETTLGGEGTREEMCLHMFIY